MTPGHDDENARPERSTNHGSMQFDLLAGLLSIQLIGEEVVIFVNGEEFIQCSNLVLAIQGEDVGMLEEVDSIDHLAEFSKEYNNAYPYYAEMQVAIQPESAFWGHCSNIQAWVEHEFDSELLHSNLAFPLLHELSKHGYMLAKECLAEEILRRLKSGYVPTVQYLVEQGFVSLLSSDQLAALARHHVHEGTGSPILPFLFEKGYLSFLSRDDLDAVHRKLTRLLDDAGAALDAIYFCPHHPDDGCECRKPNRGLIDQAVREWGMDLDRSYLIGDHVRDIELAKRIGARSILVTTGVVSPPEAEGLKTSGPIPDWIAATLGEAADWLLSDAGRLSASGRDR